MPFAETLAERLGALGARPSSPELAIADWRLVVDTATSTEIGLKDNQLGGPYDAPNSVSGTRGEIYVRWGDGKVSTGTLDLTTLENLGEDLALWRQGAFEDAFAPDVLGPQNVPSVPLYDADVAHVVSEAHGPLFQLLERFRAEMPAYETERVSGSASVSMNQRRLITSRGLDHTSRGTAFGAYVDADHRSYDYLSLRRMPSEEEVDRLIRSVGETNLRLRQEATIAAGPRTLIFSPSATESMLAKYVMGNLDGQRVLNGGSAYSLEQFRRHEAVFHPDFGLLVDPLRPLSPGSYELTREGLPAREVVLIEGGCLQTPLLDLKHAKKAGMAPTPFPRGGSSLRLSGPTVPLESLVASTDRGLLIYQLLGLHTQDGARGNFSLTVAQGLVIEEGVVMGHAKAMIAGNFPQALKAGFRLGSVAGKEVPAIAIRGDASPG